MFLVKLVSKKKLEIRFFQIYIYIYIYMFRKFELYLKPDLKNFSIY